MNFIAGYSFASTKGFWGKIPEATLSIYTIRYNRKLATYNNRHLLEYVTEANLAANYTLSDTPRYRSGSFSGFGITPIGFQLNINQNNIIQPFFKSSAGFMYFKKPFPDERGVPFNFTLELGGGIEVMVLENISLSAGYKYHHMSNGQFGEVNPGVDSNIFYTGFTIF
ncbi:acyloxyacyl hydrolase [Fodinibius sp. Rm-B-1B1-1]|uniref:acyloxyacyl hydrolase n=1 Tax=Fodinibius alkaliphilus TaxID=3140241 RepID=UPI00315AD29D